MTAIDETADIFELIGEMRDVQALNDTSVAKTHVIKKIDYERIFLVGYGDLHIENLGTDLDRIETELKIMSKIPNLFVVFMGDLTDSSVKYLNNNFDTYLTPKAAREFGYRIFDALGEKLICALSGCHEKHGEEVADYDYVEEYCKRTGVPFLNERGLLTLELANERTVNIAVAHKAQGYSMYNPFHPAIRIVRENYPEADVVIIAHQHQSGIAIQNEQGKPRAMMTIGSRKQGDRYATRRGFTPQLPNKNLPVLEILPGGFKILNDIRLLENLDEREKFEEHEGFETLVKIIGRSKAAVEKLENAKREKLKTMGFKNATPVKDYVDAESLEEEIRLRRIMAEDSGSDPKEIVKVKATTIDLAYEKMQRKIEAAAKQADVDPPTDGETKKAEYLKKDRERRRAYRVANKAKDNEYMKTYMRKYRKRKKEEKEGKGK